MNPVIAYCTVLCTITGGSFLASFLVLLGCISKAFCDAHIDLDLTLYKDYAFFLP